MSAEYERAKSTILEYLNRREEVRTKLLRYAGLGMRAQALEQTRTVGFSFDRVDEEESVPRVSDPTGESSLRPDGFLILLSELDQAESRLAAACDRLIGHPRIHHPSQIIQVLRAYRDCDEVTNRAVTDAARVAQRALSHTVDVSTKPMPGLSADGRPGCESCRRHKEDGRPKWSEPTVNKGKPTDIGGALNRKVLLCEPCYRFAIDDRRHPETSVRLPNLSELAHRENDPRGHWPELRTTGKKAS